MNDTAGPDGWVPSLLVFGHTTSSLGTTPAPSVTHLTEIVPPKPNASVSLIPQFQKTIAEEIAGLQARNVWKVVHVNDTPPGSNIIRSQFVLAFKDTDTYKPIYKARLVAQGHTDREKHELVHSSPTVRHSPLRTMATLGPLFDFRKWLLDGSQAYIQRHDAFSRDVYLIPPAELLHLKPGL